MNFVHSLFLRNVQLPAIIALIIYLFFLTGCETHDNSPSFTKIEMGFRNIPDSVQLAVYWYWISDNISKEGVVKDLEGMKEAGINRAFIGNIGESSIPYGQHKILSDEWWEITHTALKKASELGIEIGIFNSPGWSQSGGPWIKPEESMRYLASSRVNVQGPNKINIPLPDVGEEAEDVRVIAFPVSDKSTIERKWEIKKINGKNATLTMQLPCGIIARSLSIEINTPIKTEAELYYKENGEYKFLKNISIDRSNPALNVGFVQFPPVIISLPELQTNEFKLFLAPQGQGDMNITLSSKPQIERYPEKTLAKMFQSPLPLWQDYMWEKQKDISETDLVIDPEKVIDLTFQFVNNNLTWDVPEGEWTIMRTAMLSTKVTNSPASPEGIGLEVDKMSKEHVVSHFDAYIGEILRRIPPEDRTTFKVVVQDSYETGGQNWTDDMAERFEQVYCYSPIPYLPVLQGIVVGSPDISDRFLWDLRRLIADRVSYDYVGGLREISNQHGLTTWLENYGHWGYPGEFLQYGGQSDEIGGEFWSEGSLGDIENRAASSCAHIYGKRKVWAESFTSAGNSFGRYPYMMKQRGDRFFTEGINATLLHLFVHQPYEDKNPGMNAWFGNEFNRKNTWFSQMHVFSEYLKRCNFMLQQGTYVADVAYFIGEDAPKMTGVTDPPLPDGYSFDYINAEVLMKYASVKDGKLTLETGMQYSVLVLPDQETMRPELLRKISGFVEEGLILLGSAPKYSPSLTNYPKADKEVQQLANNLWGDGQTEIINYGKGRIYTRANSLEKVFINERIYLDCYVGSNTANIQFIHRSLNARDIYFLSNQDEKVNQFSIQLRVTGKQPELWNPVTGEIRLLPEYTMDAHTTTMNIELQPLESAFLVFRNKPNKKIQGENYPDKMEIATLTNPWNVSFTGLLTPENDITMNELYDISKSDNPLIKYFSGTTTYTSSFNFEGKSNDELYIDLGRVMVTAKVWLNNEYVGGVWTYPYELNINEYIKPGENSLRIEVVNNWKNRLIGDLQLPVEQRSTWTMVNPWKADSELQESGLIGPVKLLSYKYDIIK